MARNVNKVRWRGNIYNICGNELAGKADKNGFYETMGVGVSNNLTPYSSQSGVNQAIPYNMQGTGCGNGETQVDTGSFCQLKEKRGNTVVVNQLVRNPTFVDTSIWAAQKTTFTVANNVAHVVCGEEITASMGIYQYILEGYQIPSHKYLILFTVKPSVATKISAYYAGAYFPIVDVAANTSYRYSGIITLPQSPQGRALMLYINYYGTSMVEGDYADISNVSLIDLTLWFGSNDLIPAHLLSHPEDFGRYYSGSLAYNAGTLVNADGGVLKTIGRNLLDPAEFSDNKILIWTTGELYAENKSVVTDYVEIIDNTEYASNFYAFAFGYDRNKNYIGVWDVVTGSWIKNSTAIARKQIKLSGAAFVRFVYRTSENSNLDMTQQSICASLYYEGESGYDEFYPYQVLAEINTGSEILRSAGNVYDSKTPDGTITRRIGYVDLGTLTYILNTGLTGVDRFRVIAYADIKSCNNNIIPNIVCAKFVASGIVSANNAFATWVVGQDVKDLYFYTPQGTYADAAAFKTAMSGVYLYYELATPTTESGTSYAETVTIDDFGSMQFANTNGVPQGNLIFYPVDYKGFVDTAYNELDGDATQIAQKGELAVGDPDTIKGVLNLINAKIPAPPASDGAYKLTVTVSSGVATYSWEA